MGLLHCVLFFLFGSVNAAASASFFDEKMIFTLKAGRPIQVTLRLPAEASGKLPVLLLFGGFQHAADVLDLVRPTRPVILASFDYPFDPPRHFQFPESLKLAPLAKRMIHETVEGILHLVEMLKVHPKVDPSRISIVGASLGAPFAALAGAATSDLRAVVLIHGFGEVAQVISHQLMMKWRPRYGLWAWPLAWVLGRGAWLYIHLPSPEDALRKLQVSQSLLLIEAEHDTFVPESARKSLWSAAQDSKAGVFERIVMEGEHLQPGSEALIAEILKRVELWGGECGLW